MKQRIVGLDTGTNSLGWAVVDRNEDFTYTLIRHGVLIFPEGVDEEKGEEKSRAAKRTKFRSARKHHFRRRLLKIKLLKVLIKYGLCPRLSEAELHEWQVHKKYPLNEDFLQWQRTNENEGKNPYHDRHRCLHEKLNLETTAGRYVLGRALYHLVQRRGFLSNRLDSTAESKETGAVKEGIANLSKEMQDAGFEYLGDYFFWLYSQQGYRVRIRHRYTDREEHYYKEFQAICKQQSLPENCIKELHDALYFQRPLKSQKQAIGKCKFEKAKSRCIESHPDFEEFRMLQTLNHIRIRTPKDDSLRPLNEEERRTAATLFYRESKPTFNFEDIAKKLAGKNNYAYEKDDDTYKPYLFNFRMTQSLAGCPTTALFRAIWGDEWKQALAETYTRNTTKTGPKTEEEMVNDVWNVLYSFSSQTKLKEFAIEKLQLTEAEAEKFSRAKNIGRGTASISLKAVRKILPYLRKGLPYSHAVFLANLGAVVPAAVWNDNEQRETLIQEVQDIVQAYDPRQKELTGTLEFCIKDFLKDRYELDAGATDKLYHPSMIEAYPDARPDETGCTQLGSPASAAIRNPMAMRSLHQIRRLINRLLREGIITQDTEIHIEYARELNDANRRKAMADTQKEQENARNRYREELVKLYKEETGREIIPTERDIEKYQLWEEQERRCLYTGKSIGVADFVGDHPKFDIEHTVPRSRGGDNTMTNKTLCEMAFNRQVKGTRLPSELPNHEEIMERLKGWKKKIDELSRQIDRQHASPLLSKEQKDRIIQKKHRLTDERDYWQNKYKGFVMKEVPEGFSRRQGAGIGLISKYAGLYLRSLFHSTQNKERKSVHVVKGAITAEFRRMWGLQEAYAPKSRDNHAHHGIDAIVIACIGKREYDQMAHFYKAEETYEAGNGEKPQFPKPWATFTEDVLRLADTLLIPHSTPDTLGKAAKKRIKVKGKTYLAKGDSARGRLHKETYYGAIQREGEIKYVVRKALSDLKESDVDLVVDDAVRQRLREEIEQKGFKTAMAGPAYMNREKGIMIKKVRIYCPKVQHPLKIRQHRDLSDKPYKRRYYVENDSNYAMAIYEGVVEGKVERKYELVNSIDAARFYKRSTDRSDFPELVPIQSQSPYNLPIRCLLRIGTMVLLWEKHPDEVWELTAQELNRRLYKITGLSHLRVQNKYEYGTITMKFHQEARPSGALKEKKGLYKQEEAYRPIIKLLHTQFNALVEGVDFELTLLGEIRPLKKKPLC